VQAPLFNLKSSHYMPHIVIQDRSVRSVVIEPGNEIVEDYQAVAFVEGPDDYRLGESGRFVLELMYHPRLPYDDVRPGATFTVREGARIVAHGIVLKRGPANAA